MNITIRRGPDSALLLSDTTFRAEWAALCERCPWSTSYQLPAFAGTWYRVYARKYDPVIVIARSETSALRGVLCLAVSIADGELVAAGATQSEYQTWISEPECGNDFALAAVLAVRREFPGKVLELRYLPPSVPLDWLNDRRIRSNSVLTPKRRPLLRFAEMDADSLNKANNKKRLKGLKKLGELEFRRLTGADELAAIFDEFANWYDLRLGAMHGFEPFAGDPLRKSFQLELMKEPGLLHATILKAGERLASAHINVCDKTQLHLNLIGYNPLLAKHSPGKFHIHLLTQMLVADGVEELDLTPGGDPYKERFTNRHDTAYILSFHPTMLARAKTLAQARGEELARRGLSKLRVHPARARDALESISPARVQETLRIGGTEFRKRIFSQRETRLYTRPLAPPIERLETSGGFRRDAIEDLLAYRPSTVGLSRKRFLFDAMNRLEEGQRAYTCVRDGRLRFTGWVMQRPTEAFVDRMIPGLKLPPGHALIMELRDVGGGCDSVLGRGCLAAMFSDLAPEKGIDTAMMAVSADRAETALLEEAGFAWKESLVTKTIFGLARVKLCQHHTVG